MAVDLGEPKKLSTPVIAFVLWLATVLLATWNFLILRQMVLRTYGRLLSASTVQANDVGSFIHTVLVMILAVAWIGVVIGGAEFHYRRVGQPNSWKLFSRTLAVELSILLLALFV